MDLVISALIGVLKIVASIFLLTAFTVGLVAVIVGAVMASIGKTLRRK